MTSSVEIPSNAPKPRQCHVVKWPDFDGYGFNLHADKNKPGQYIGKVDNDSPASVAGLKEGDRIIEVNGVNIANENHKQVVQRIKNVPNETRLLVVDTEADRWYKEHNIVVFGDQSNIIHGSSANRSPSTEEENITNANGHVVTSEEEVVSQKTEDDVQSVASAQSSSHSESSSTQPQPLPTSEETPMDQDPVPSPTPLVHDPIPDSSPMAQNQVPDSSSLDQDPVPDSSPMVQDPVPDSSPMAQDPVPDSSPMAQDPVPDFRSLDLDPVPDSTPMAQDPVPESSSLDQDPLPAPSPIGVDKQESSSDDEEQDEPSKQEEPETSSNHVEKEEVVQVVNGGKIAPEEESLSNRNGESDSLTNENETLKEENGLITNESESLKDDSSTNEIEKPLDPPPQYEAVDSSSTEKSPMSTTPTPPPSIEPEVTTAPPKNYQNGGLNLNMTAAEMRAHLRSKKKVDPRNDALDLKRKYQIIQNM